MAVHLNPYLHFPGTAREAMAFYAGVFGGAPEVLTFGAAGMPGVDPEGVMHSYLRGDNGFELMGADIPEQPGFDDYRSRGNVTISLSGDDEAALTGYWERLVEGGVIGQPLSKAPWGDSYGDFTDRFGIRWLVNISGSAA